MEFKLVNISMNKIGYNRGLISIICITESKGYKKDLILKFFRKHSGVKNFH